jgi:hypothetical protein
MPRVLVKCAFTAMALVATTQNALAVTECDKYIYSIYNGDGLILMLFQGGGSAFVFNAHTSFNTISASALSALLSARLVTVRYSADGVSCSASDRTDVLGLWIR